MGVSRALAFKTHSSETLLCGNFVGFTKKLEGERNIFKSGKGGKKVEKLKDKAEALAPQVSSPFLSETLKVMSFYFNVTLCRPVKPGNKVEKRCFSGPALAEEGHNFSWQYLEVCSPEGNSVLAFIAILFPKIYNPDNRLHLLNLHHIQFLSRHITD
jgi:hypothetical protein